MMDPQKRTKEIERLDRLRLEGDRARYQREAIEEVFAEQHKRYVSLLIGKTRSQGDVSSPEVWKLVALDDMLQDLDQAVGEGRSAEKKLADLRRQAEAFDTEEMM